MTSPNISPCSRLNDDILREIFIHCISGDGNYSQCFKLDKYTPPIHMYSQLSVSRVCSSWRRVALFTPQLWNNVMIRWLTESNLSIARRYLSHARNLPISITLGPNMTGWQDWYPPLSNLLSSYRLRSLTLPAMNPRFNALLHDLPGRSVETLESLSLFVRYNPEEAAIDLNDVKYPKLASITISGAYRISAFGSSLRIFDGRLLSMTVIDGWDLLSRCPSLEEVRLRMRHDRSLGQPPEPRIHHRHLRTLIFESKFQCEIPFSAFIAALALPSLEKMHLFNAWSVTAFQSLAQRSNYLSNLSDFLLNIPTSDVDVGTLLASMPSITRVSLSCDRFNGTVTFDQRALDGLASGLLAPRLQYLVGRISNGKEFMDMVESRMINAEMSSNGVPAPFSKVVVTSLFGSDVARLHDMQRQGIPIYRYLL